MGRPDPLSPDRFSWLSPTVVAAVVAVVVAGVLVSPTRSSTSAITAEPLPAATRSTPAAPTSRAPTPAEPAREGTQAPSQVDRFEPAELILPDKQRADVVPVATADGELQVPKHVDRLGWWDGSAWLGDPFGATVIAGHVDSATEGLGFFAQLLGIRTGQRVTILGDHGQRQTYEVTSVRTIAQNALADGRTLDQTGDHRLVLITCTGAYTPGKGYSSNLVVTAKQID